ncbi:Zinc finger protein, partial [Pseudolycoriella hygida]
GCIEPFKNKRSLEIHQNKKHKIKIATREKQKKLSCQRCSKKFLTKVNLDAHIRVVHEGLKPYKCPHCEKEFGGIRAYKRHLMFKHEALEKKFFPCVLPFACETCPKTFLTKYQLKLHTMRHLNIKPFVCPTCGMRKTTNKELEAHLNFHTKEKTYPCKECPRVFSSVGAISRHWKRQDFVLVNKYFLTFVLMNYTKQFALVMTETFLSRCRACAELHTNKEEMVCLFSENNVSEMFTNCTSLEVSSHDCLPSLICFECYGHLKNFNEFRQSCFDSDKLLRAELAIESLKVETLKENEIKLEEDDPIPNRESDFDEIELSDRNSLHSDSDFNGVSHGDRDSIFNDTVEATDANLDLFDDTKYICDMCGQQFEQKSHIGSHMLKHKKEMGNCNATKFLCTVKGCAKSFDKRKFLNCHQKNVHKMQPDPPKKMIKLLCQQCPKQFVMQYKLDAHIREVHEGLKPYKCPHCEKEFANCRPYNHHLQFRHGTSEKRKIYRCTYDDCDKEYNLNDSLRAHVNRFHLGIIPDHKNQNLMCDQCGRVFKCVTKLKLFFRQEHTYSHTGVLPFGCKTCPKTFATSYQLKLHTMRHLNIKPFVCPTCGLRKMTDRELKTHMNFHSKEITYPCKECPRVFASNSAIGRHVRIHHRNHKPYICPHCQRSFAKAETMKNHIMTHTGEKPFACTVCGHRFIQSVALRSHMKVHEKKSSTK